MWKICGVDDVRTKNPERDIKKEEARQEVGMALHVNNEMVIKKICEGGNKSGLYDHMLIEKGKKKRDGKVKLIGEEGEPIDDERKVKSVIEKFWGDLYTWQKERDGGMRNEVGYICEKELNIQHLHSPSQLVQQGASIFNRTPSDDTGQPYP